MRALAVPVVAMLALAGCSETAAYADDPWQKSKGN